MRLRNPPTVMPKHRARGVKYPGRLRQTAIAARQAQLVLVPLLLMPSMPLSNTSMCQGISGCHVVLALDGQVDAVLAQDPINIGSGKRLYKHHTIKVPMYHPATYWFVGAWDPQALQNWGQGWLWLSI